MPAENEDTPITQSESPIDLQEKPILNIVGEKVALGPFNRGVIPHMTRWLNDFAVTLFSGDSLCPITRESIEADIERDLKEVQRNKADFLMYERATMRLIGLIELRHIDYRHSTAEFGILIGEKDCWSKGYGTEATILILDYAFTVLGLHNILLDTDSYNERAIHAYTRAGFRIIGRRRQTRRWGDKVYDTVMMDCISTEFHNPIKRVLELP